MKPGRKKRTQAGEHDAVMEFSVIAGSLKGRRVLLPDPGVTRPPLARLRRSIFDFLAPYLEGVRFLDLYSGTGSYLFEAVSRGVREAAGVEREEALAEVINQYAERFGIDDRLSCRAADVIEAVRKLHGEKQLFSIIMMAPPQYKGLIDETLAVLREHPVLVEGGMVVCQHDSSETDSIDWGPAAVSQRRKYGNTTFTILSAP